MLSIFLAACTKEELKEKAPAPLTSPLEGNEGTITPSSKSVLIPTSVPSPAETKSFSEREQNKLDEERRRKGKIKMDNIENAGVEGSLLEGVMALLEAVKYQDEEAKLNLHYERSHMTFDAVEEPYIHAFTKIELDNTEVKGMTDEYNLRSFASDVAIVKITVIRLDINLKVSESTGNYIFVKVDDQWKVFRSF